jgi:cell division protein FtsZ
VPANAGSNGGSGQFGAGSGTPAFTTPVVAEAAPGRGSGPIVFSDEVADAGDVPAAADAYGPAGAYPLSAPVAEAEPEPGAVPASAGPSFPSASTPGAAGLAESADSDATLSGSPPATANDPGQSVAAVNAGRRTPAETAGKTFEVATSRRRPVVFEEDDDLDIPDFLK